MHCATQARPLSINIPWASELLWPTARRVYTAPSKNKMEGEKNQSSHNVTMSQTHKQGNISGFDLKKLPVEKEGPRY